MSVQKELLEILACPNCKGKLVKDGDRVVCASCGLRYPVRDGIPVLIVEEAEKVER
ncbi:Trm112 family protein [Geomonas sp.]|uniref:Trm112 family protein n=1 Tax=Geomonas sp. TaxID=2651584 RepID=UPI002B475AB5|nr:Trm112 family protein [Geomonas sp.]HJV35502.1 Trm112 family protein [Geomonas sp.]